MDGRPARACAKVQHPRQLLLVEFLHEVPKPLDHWMGRIVGVLILCVVMPVLQVDERHPV